jgi:hypothetical protein
MILEVSNKNGGMGILGEMLSYQLKEQQSTMQSVLIVLYLLEMV